MLQRHVYKGSTASAAAVATAVAVAVAVMGVAEGAKEGGKEVKEGFEGAFYFGLALAAGEEGDEVTEPVIDVDS